MSQFGVLSRGFAILIVGSGFLGLPACEYFKDSRARFSLDNVIFDKVQVISAFPAYIDPQTNSVTRVCGRSLDPEATLLKPNGVELTVNLVSTGLTAAVSKCDPDWDQGIREGQRIEMLKVSASSDDPTLTPANFELQWGCYEPRTGVQSPNTCSGQSSGFGTKSPAAAVKYKAVTAGRCDPVDSATWQNLAILVDHSGSTQGNIYTDTGDCSSATVFKEDAPSSFKTPKELTECSSDRHRVLFSGATSLIESLNPPDRVLTLYFDETEAAVRVACTDDLRCQKTDGETVEVTKKACISSSMCPYDYQCAADEDFNNDTYKKLSLSDQMNRCFGSSNEAKAQNRLGLAQRTLEIAAGRSPVFQALATAGTFLRTINPTKPRARQIVLLTDGPDSCTYSDLFQFVDPNVGKGGNCRKPCAMATADYQAVLKVLTQPQFPVRVHVIQLQSKPHPLPDAYLQDIACRTEGTYQFINALDLHPNDPIAMRDAMSRAIAAVRFSLSGTWRVGFRDTHVASGAVPVGQVTAMRGRLSMWSSDFDSLQEVFKNEKEWMFEQFETVGSLSDEVSTHDRRMIFHVGCSTDAECGGSDPCGVHHCSAAGECIAAVAPDLLPCGPDGQGKCCGGACQADGICEGVCKE